MNCQEFEQKWIALDSGDLSPAMDAHRQRCHSCSEMVEDLNYVAEQARMMGAAADDPPERVWLQIRQRLEREGLIHEPRRGLRAGWLGGAATGWLMRVPAGLAYASVFLMAAGVMYLHSLMQSPEAPAMVAGTPAVPEAAWTQAMVDPVASPTEQDVQDLAQRVSEEHRATFVSTWNQMNSSVQQLSDFLQAHPDDPFLRSQLMNAVQQRKHLWETYVRWEEF
jgi:hypothetical protein